MGQFKRARLSGSDELFRPTRPQGVEGQQGEQQGEAGASAGSTTGSTGALEPPGGLEGTVKADSTEPRAATLSVGLSVPELKAIVDALQLARFPERQRTRPTMVEFERLGELQDRLRRLVAE